MAIGNSFHAGDRGAWRGWLTQNHARCDEVWLIFFKKSVGKPSLEYGEAVDEALCFGWIDGQKRKIDEQRYAYRFTPRRPKSSWTRQNIERAERLIAEGRMAPAGLAAFQAPDRRETAPLPGALPEELERKFRKNRAAWSYFETCPPGYRKLTTGWVASAKKEETRAARLEKLMEMSAKRERLKFM